MERVEAVRKAREEEIAEKERKAKEKEAEQEKVRQEHDRNLVALSLATGKADFMLPFIGERTYKTDLQGPAFIVTVPGYRTFVLVARDKGAEWYILRKNVRVQVTLGDALVESKENLEA